MISVPGLVSIWHIHPVTPPPPTPHPLSPAFARVCARALTAACIPHQHVNTFTPTNTLTFHRVLSHFPPPATTRPRLQSGMRMGARL